MCKTCLSEEGGACFLCQEVPAIRSAEAALEVASMDQLDFHPYQMQDVKEDQEP